MPLMTGTVVGNHYRVVKLLGQGGFGAVYRAWDVNLNKTVALKENLDTSPEAQRQFQREAQILASLNHPNLPRVTDYFLVPGIGQYLVMDFVDGQDLQNALDQAGGPLRGDQALAWIAQVCDALVYLHTQNPPIIHRDIKPANIKITSQGRAVLVDFGISKVYDPSLRTTVGARAVTPGYSPPEQYGQGQTDTRTDIYALGATLYALLTGQEPQESVQRIVDGALLPPHRINPLVPAGVGQVVEQAMSLSPSRRYKNAADFKVALTLLGQAPSPRPYVSPAPPPQPVAQPITLPHAPTGGSINWLWVIGIGIVLFLIVVVVGSLSGLSRVQTVVQVITATPEWTATAQTARTATAQARALEMTAARASATDWAQQTATVQARQTDTSRKLATIAAILTSTPLPTWTPSPRPIATRQPPTPTPLVASMYIPSLNAHVTRLQFFESGYDRLPKDQTVYGNRFAKATSRYIYWELGLEHPKPGHHIDFSIYFVIYSNGSVFATDTATTFLEADWSDSWHSKGQGWANPGNWRIGFYTVDLFIAGNKVASGSFEIY